MVVKVVKHSFVSAIPRAFVVVKTNIRTTIQTDLTDKEPSKAALKGADSVFAVTNLWDPSNKPSADGEFQQGKNNADAAKEAGVNFFIWSSLLNITERKSSSHLNAGSG